MTRAFRCGSAFFLLVLSKELADIFFRLRETNKQCIPPETRNLFKVEEKDREDPRSFARKTVTLRLLPRVPSWAESNDFRRDQQLLPI